MIVEIHARSFRLTPTIRSHVKRSLECALGELRHSVARARVTLFDINGPRGGIDKRCRVDLSVPHQTAVNVKDTQRNVYVAVEHAAARASRALRRRVSRRRQLERARPHRRAAVETPLLVS